MARQSVGWAPASSGSRRTFSTRPEFFEANDDDIDFIDSSNVLTFMGNAIIGIPLGGQRGGGFRPFGVAGIGLVTSHVESVEAATDVDNSDFGFNVGFGAMGFLSDHVGFRGDMRYVRSFNEIDTDDLTGITAGDFDFWRANVGVTFRW